jgi:uncharacterized protein (TIGR02145 family)
VVLGGITSATNGTIQEASLLAYLWRRPAATDNQPNTNTWSRVTDDNNVFDTGTINSNFPDRYKSGITTSPTNFGFIYNYPETSATANPGKYGENFLAIKLDCTENEKGFRMTSFTTTAPQDGIEYEWALTLVLTDTSTGCTAPLDSVGANAMVYVHDANFYYDGTWGGTITPTNPPKFIFNNTTPITNDAYEYKTGMTDGAILNPYVKATPYLDSIPFHLQDNRTRLKFSSEMYKITVVTAGSGSSQIITFGALGAPYNDQLINSIQAPNIQQVYDRNDNMSPGMTVWKVPQDVKSPSAAVEVGRIETITNNTTFRFNPTPPNTLAVNDVIIIKQSQDNSGQLWARTKFGNSIRQLYRNEACTQKWQPPVADKFYVVQTQTDQNMKGAGVLDSLLLGKVSNNPLYCMNLGEKGKVYVNADQGANVKFNVQTCWDAGLFEDLESTYVNIAYVDGGQPRVYRNVWTTKNFNKTTYRDGTPIPEKPSHLEWNNATSGAYCNYNNNPADSDTYGKLYNWYTTRDPINPNLPSNRLAPYGWMIPDGDLPNDMAFNQFLLLRRAAYFGYGQTGDIKYKAQFWKEIGTAHWTTNTTPASNDNLRFTAIGNGLRIQNALEGEGFGRRNIEARYWTTYYNSTFGEYRFFRIGATSNPNYSDWDRDDVKTYGFSVRFVKENMNTPGVYGRPLIQYLGIWDYDTVLTNG